MTINRHHGNGRFNRIVEHESTIYLCGMLAADEHGDIHEQTRSALGRIDESLAEVDSDKTKILTATIYLASMRHFEKMNEVWDAWVSKGNEPARTCIEARLARPEFLVEITIIASK